MVRVDKTMLLHQLTSCGNFRIRSTFSFSVTEILNFYQIFICQTCSGRSDDARLVSYGIKIFKSGPSKVCGRQPLKNLKRIF